MEAPTQARPYFLPRVTKTFVSSGMNFAVTHLDANGKPTRTEQNVGFDEATRGRGPSSFHEINCQNNSCPDNQDLLTTSQSVHHPEVQPSAILPKGPRALDQTFRQVLQQSVTRDMINDITREMTEANPPGTWIFHRISEMRRELPILRRPTAQGSSTLLCVAEGGSAACETSARNLMRVNGCTRSKVTCDPEMKTVESRVGFGCKASSENCLLIHQADACPITHSRTRMRSADFPGAILCKLKPNSEHLSIPGGNSRPEEGGSAGGADIAPVESR